MQHITRITSPSNRSLDSSLRGLRIFYAFGLVPYADGGGGRLLQAQTSVCYLRTTFLVWIFAQFPGNYGWQSV